MLFFNWKDGGIHNSSALYHFLGKNVLFLINYSMEGAITGRHILRYRNSVTPLKREHLSLKGDTLFPSLSHAATRVARAWETL